MKALACILLVATWTSSLSAQDTTRTTVDSVPTGEAHPYRSPRRALILGSLIPGAGHIYSGEYVRGFVNNQSTLAPIGLGVMVFTVSRMCSAQFFSTDHCARGPQWVPQLLGVMAVGAGVWRWVSTARDARRAAERANERHRRKWAAAKPTMEVPVESRGDWRVGLAIPW